ncbi:serine/threonine-protein kinase [Streptomyces boluensis]|uniref:Protein kinase n=1 Tax=Streptomyces boluensis TaxID=1775135 RepID=A0A964UU75_9ACTN|nr:serine/threonine-protein kinase [Streptomyces boluensis]NBE55504.1 protein kinase [Streptomyces boluensis]
MDALTTEDPPRIGRYRLLARLGAGGMGRVYLARSEGGRTVAVKVIHAEFAQHPEFRRRFTREVAAARRVGGRWTAPVLDADTEAETPWVATGYVPGPDLHTVVARDHGPLPEASVLALAAGLTHALEAIHGAALVHRDLKPSNVLLTIDGPRVIDFGIARALDPAVDGIRTNTGAVIGSPGFMSPEQVRGQRLTPASDVFCLGSVLAYAATGGMPFGTADSGMHAVMFRIAEEEPDLTGLPEAVLALVRDCLAKTPEARPSVPQLLARTRDAAIGPGSAWLPGALLADLGRRTAQLLDADAPPTQLSTAPGPYATPPPAPAPQAYAPQPYAAQAPATPQPDPYAVTAHAVTPSPSRSRTRSRAVRVAWVAAATVLAVVAAAGIAFVLRSGETPDDDSDLAGSQGQSSGSEGSGGQGSGPAKPEAASVDGTWEGLVQHSESSVSDEHEFLRVTLDRDKKTAAFAYLTPDAYCKVTSKAGDMSRGTVPLSAYRTVKWVRHKDSVSKCDLNRVKSLKLASGRLSWTTGDKSAELRRTRPTARPIPEKFLGTWKSEMTGTLKIEQGPAGTRVAKYTGWSIDYRCNGSAELVVAAKNTVTLSPMELDPTTPRNIGCPHSVAETITWKSENELELRYPESIAVRLTRVG